MEKRPNQSLKALYMKECFERMCDDEHPLTIQDIRDYLESKDVYVSKDRTIAEGVKVLNSFGMGITHKPRTVEYYYPDRKRLFNPAEIQILIDCVQAATNLPTETTLELIEKLKTLCSDHQRRDIHPSDGVFTCAESRDEGHDLNASLAESVTPIK